MKLRISKKTVAVLLLAAMGFLFVTPSVIAADCSSPDITLTSQVEVDAFQSTYGGGGVCDTVTNSLTISGADIGNLDALSNLEHVGQDLQISFNPGLSNIDGLINLTTVGRNFENWDNASLADVDGLANLATIIGDFETWQNSSLTNFDGLASLTTIGGDLYIVNNDSLLEIDGLMGLSSVGERLYIQGNPLLQNLAGLSQLTSIAGSWYIYNNASLTTLASLLNLTTVGGFLHIENNNALVDLNGLENVAEVNGYLRVANNAILANVQGLQSLSTVTGDLVVRNNDEIANLDSLVEMIDVGGSLEVTANSKLGNCQGLALLLGWPSGPPNDAIGASITFATNKNGCNSVLEILASVSGPTAPLINTATPDSHNISLDFEHSTTTDSAFPVESYKAECIGESAESSFVPQAAELIPDPGSLTKFLEIQDFDLLATSVSLEIDIDISHPRTRHLVISLTSPEDTTLSLWDEGVGTGTDLIGTFPNSLIPVDDFAVVSAQNPNGVWEVVINDVVTGFQGALNSLAVRVNEKAIAFGESSPLVIDGLRNGQTYTCVVAPITKLGIFPESDEAAATPMPPEVIFQNSFETTL